MMEELENLFKDIDKSYKDIHISEKMKCKIQEECLIKKSNRYGKMIASLTIALSVGLISLNVNNIYAFGKSIVLNVFADDIYYNYDELYMLQSSVFQENDKGYIKVKSCVIQNGFVDLEFETTLENITTLHDEGVKLVSSNKEYKLKGVVSGQWDNDSQAEICDVRIKGKTDITDGKFTIKLPSMDVLVDCQIPKSYSSINDIETNSSDNNIHIVALKQEDNNNTIISLKAFDKNNALLDIETDSQDITFIDTNGNPHKCTDYDWESNRYYTDIPYESLSRVEISKVNKQIMLKELNAYRLEGYCRDKQQNVDDYLELGVNNPVLKYFFDTKQITEKLKIPEVGETTVLNKVINIGEYRLCIKDISCDEKSVIKINLDKSQNSNDMKISMIDWNAKSNGEYIEYEYSDKEDFIIIEDRELQEELELIIDGIWIEHLGEWNIKFD